jgi:hypothetical protein
LATPISLENWTPDNVKRQLNSKGLVLFSGGLLQNSAFLCLKLLSLNGVKKGLQRLLDKNTEGGDGMKIRSGYDIPSRAKKRDRQPRTGIGSAHGNTQKEAFRVS